jgi:hypothetical protein
MGAISLWRDLGISKNEAQHLIDGLTYGIPGFAKMKDRLVKKRKRTKRIKLILRVLTECSHGPPTPAKKSLKCRCGGGSFQECRAIGGLA